MAVKTKVRVRLKGETEQLHLLSKEETYEESIGREVFTVIDIETSGLSPLNGGEIIELAAVRVVRGRIVDSYDTLIEPRNGIQKKTTQITGIQPSDLKGQPTINEVLPKLLTFMGNSTLVAHNASFEERFLTHFFEKSGYAPTNKWLCTMKLFRKLYPERKKLGLTSKLDDLTAHYKVDFTEEEHHRALPDTIATAKAFIEMRKEVLLPERIQAELMQSTDIADIPVEEAKKLDQFTITGVRYWEKCYNKKRDTWARRLYVNFDSGDAVSGVVYYDLYAKAYEIQKCEDRTTREKKLVNIPAFEQALLAYLRVPDIQTYLKQKGVFKRAHEAFQERIADKTHFMLTLHPEAVVHHEGYQKGDIPFDVFRIESDEPTPTRVLVTNEKRGNKYRIFFDEADIS